MKNSRGKVQAFHTHVGVSPTHSAFQFYGKPPVIPVNQIGSGAAGAETSFNKVDVTGGAFSIGTPLSGKHSRGAFRKAGLRRGF